MPRERPFDAFWKARDAGNGAGGTGGTLGGSGGIGDATGSGGVHATFDAGRDGAPREAATDAGEDSSRDAGGARDGGRWSDGAALSDARGTEAAPSEDGAVACAGAKVWEFGFDSDPTAADTDHDGVLDWVLRNATAFPVSELQNGIWHSQTRIVLDTRPMDDFGSRTIVDVRMRSVTVPTSGRGAVFWVNLNEANPSFSALFVSLALQANGGQTLALFGKSAAAEVMLASFPNLPSDLIAVHLDIDPVGLNVALAANGSSLGSYAIPETGPPNQDHFATLLAWEGVADFDSVRIVRCPP